MAHDHDHTHGKGHQMSEPTTPPADSGSKLICVPCWATTQGATMTPAKAIVHGLSLCESHLTKVYDVLEAQPDVTPH